MATVEELNSNYTSFIERVLDVEEDPRTDFAPMEGYQNQISVPLDTAVKKLHGIMRSVSHNLSIARERISKIPEDELTAEESVVIYLYTMGKMSNSQSLHECLNDALRFKNQTELGPYFPYLKLFITALSKLKSVRQTVYRGSKTDLSEKYSVGETFIWSEFSSCLTSAQLLSSEPFSGVTGVRTFFKINCETGKDIRQYSSLSTENEIILVPGTKFKVLSKTSPSIDLHIIEIEEIERSHMLRPNVSPIASKINEFLSININPEDIDTQLLSECITLLHQIQEQRDRVKADFSSMNINDEQVRWISNEVKTNKNWKGLNLIDNKIGNPGVAHLSAALLLNSTLETLSLDDNYVTDYGIDLLTEALKKHSTLAILTLSGMHMQDNSAKSLSLLLRTNSTLTELSLDHNIIGDSGMIALCEILEQHNRTLKKFWVNDNNITDQSVEAIVAFRTMNRIVDDFRYHNNRFTKQGLNTLQTAIKKHEEGLISLSSIDEVAVVYLELKCVPEKRLSRDASFVFTNFRRLLDAAALENFIKTRVNNTIYLILCCTDDSIIRMISSFCSKKKILLYVLGSANNDKNKNSNIFSAEESMIFRLTTRISSHYRSFGDGALHKGDKEQARIYFQHGIDMQEKLVIYLKKRRINPNQNDTCNVQKAGQFINSPTTKSLILNIEN